MSVEYTHRNAVSLVTRGLKCRRRNFSVEEAVADEIQDKRE